LDGNNFGCIRMQKSQKHVRELALCAYSYFHKLRGRIIFFTDHGYVLLQSSHFNSLTGMNNNNCTMTLSRSSGKNHPMFKDGGTLSKLNWHACENEMVGVHGTPCWRLQCLQRGFADQVLQRTKIITANGIFRKSQIFYLCRNAELSRGLVKLLAIVAHWRAGLSQIDIVVVCSECCMSG